MGINYANMPVFVCGAFTSEGDQGFLDINGIREHGIVGRGPYEPSIDQSGISMYDTPNPTDRIYIIGNKYYKANGGIVLKGTYGDVSNPDVQLTCIGYDVLLDFAQTRKINLA